MKIEIRDQTYKVMHRGTYRLRIMKDLKHLISIIEKNISFSIKEIMNYEDDWF